MANDVYQAVGPQNNMGAQVGQQFNNFMKNPMQFLMNRKINIPQQYADDPHGAVQYLLNNGQMNQNQLNQLTQMAGKMGIKLS